MSSLYYRIRETGSDVGVEAQRILAEVEAEQAALREQLAEADAAVLDYINAPSVPDAPVFCCHCEHEIARCPTCGKAEWNIKGLKSEIALRAEVTSLSAQLDKLKSEAPRVR